jgi:glycine cleavage system H protein
VEDITMVALLVLFTILTFLTIDYFVQRAGKRTAEQEGRFELRPSAVSLEGLATPPGDVFLAPGHAWLRIEPSGSVRIGSDRLAPALLGGVTHADIQPLGTRIRRGKPLATLVRDGKTVTLRSPVDGIVTEINRDVVRDPAVLREDPFGSGWIARVEPIGLGAALQLMVVAREASDWMRGELRRLRDALVQGEPALAVSLPDGGLPIDGVAHDLDPAAWERVARCLFGGDEEVDR